MQSFKHAAINLIKVSMWKEINTIFLHKLMDILSWVSYLLVNYGSVI